MSSDDSDPWSVKEDFPDLSTPPPKPKFRVAICGGGIGGLCLAVALSGFPDIEVDVYEATNSFREIGAGVMIWGRTWTVMSLLGLDEELRGVAGVNPDGSEDPPFGFEFRRADQSTQGRRITLLSKPFKTHLFHRAHFLDVLVSHLPKQCAHLGKRLRTYRQSQSRSGLTEPIDLFFADGSTATCDVLVGCDGIKSVVRHRMLGDLAAKGDSKGLQYTVHPFWSGSVTYRALIPEEKLPRGHSTLTQPMMYCGVNKHIVSYPIAKGKIVNFVGFVTEPRKEGSQWDKPWVTESTTIEVRNHYAGWEPEVQEMLKHIERPLKWAIHQLHPLEGYVDNHVALLGDAAHAMTPHQGAGAGQSIEDAYVLANLLGHPSTNKLTLRAALLAYEHVRLPFANRVIEGSRNAGAMYELRSPHKDNYSTLGPAIQNQWGWVEQDVPEAQLQRAVKWMQAEIAKPLHTRL